MPLKRKCDATSGNTPKKKKYAHSQQFLGSYSITYPVLQKLEKGNTFAHCVACNLDFGVSHGGITDCEVHITGKRHEANVKKMESDIHEHKTQFSIMQFNSGKKEEEDMQHKVMSAELLFTNFLVEHNILISAADHAGPLLKKMFPDSKIAQRFQCARTKTSVLIKHNASSISTDIVQKSCYLIWLSTDGSNDNSDKFFLIILTHSDDGRVRLSLLSVPVVKEPSATGQNIFNMLDAELHKYNLNWDKCLAFGSDNAPVMSGTKKSVLGLIKEKNDAVYFAGCPCHLLHIAAKQGAQQLGVDIEDALTDIYYYFKHSSKRQSNFKEIQNLFGMEQLKVL